MSPETPQSLYLSTTGRMYLTHRNYIKCMNRLFDDVEIEVKIDTSSWFDPSVSTRFERLADITRESIEADLLACEHEPEYSSVVAPWIPVKCYYRVYYLMAIFLYYLTGDRSGFHNGGHHNVRKNFRLNLESGKIGFTGPFSADLSQVSAWETANAFALRPGSNIRDGYHYDSDCLKSIRKKISDYIKIDWMLRGKIKHFKSIENRQKRDTQLKPKKFLLTDYFYWMRIKANYRDVDFLDFDQDITALESYEYLKQFIEASEKFASALEKAILAMKIKRGISQP